MVEGFEKSGGKKSMRVFICIISIVIVALLIASYLLQPLDLPDKQTSEFDKNLAALEKACAELTMTNEEGHVYEPIVGRYLGSKSQVYKIHGPGPKVTNLKLVLRSEVTEEEIHYSLPSEKSEHLFQKLFYVVGKETVEKKIDTLDRYGICAFKIKLDNSFGELETLIRLENSDD